MTAEQPSKPIQPVIERREFLKRAAVGAGAVAMGMAAMGLASSSAVAAPGAGDLGAGVGVPTAKAWKFGVMADSQWLTKDDGLNPNTCAVGLIQPLQQAFIAAGVKFVAQVGDLADKANTSVPSSEPGYSASNIQAEDTRALFAQALYAAGIGFFPVRGNHDDSAATALEFQAIFPQTRTGRMNQTPARVFAGQNPDTARQPSPAAGGAAFTVGANFGAVGSPSANLDGLSYGFDCANARFILIDQFLPTDGKGPDGNAYTVQSSVALQQAWISQALAGKPRGGHAFLFAHKGIILQQHVDVLFGDCPADATGAFGAGTWKVAAGGANAFIRAMAGHGARLLFCGHDHNHTRSIVKTTDGGAPAQITQVLCQSVSSKFYTPNEDDSAGNPLYNSPIPPATSNDAYFCGGQRQVMLSRELYTVGYYIVTVDGANVTVDYYSAPVYPAFGDATENLITATPASFHFTRRETFGYGLDGREFVLGHGADYSSVTDTGPSGTVASLLAGTNGNANTDLSGRRYCNAVNTGWMARTPGTASDLLYLWGMATTLGSPTTDTYVLSMTYDPAKGGSSVLATPDAKGHWTAAVNQNTGGATNKVSGPWKAGLPLGSYGRDPASGTVWAVLNYNGVFAAVPGA